MAVARIIASSTWHRGAASVMRDMPKASRELARAAERRERCAELMDIEVRALRRRLPEDELVARAVSELEVAEEFERLRSRPGNVIATLRDGRAGNNHLKRGGKTVSTITRSRRSPEEWEELAREILPELQSGKRLSDFNGLIGSNVSALRLALARLGYDGRGEPIQMKKITGSRPAVVAKRVAARRREKVPWWQLEAESGISYADLGKLLSEHGYSRKGEPVDGSTS